MTRGVGDDIDERFVTTAAGVQHRDAVDDSGRCSFPSFALQDDRHRLGDPTCVDGGANVGQELPGRAWSVPPPSRGSRSDHVGCVNEKHGLG